MKTVNSKDGTPIAYDESGQGSALILVGGAMGFRKFSGAVELSGLLSTYFTVINFDRRGRGDSGDAGNYAVSREIEDIAALVKAVGGSAYLYGMSSGAALSLAAAAEISGIKKLVLYEPPFVGVDKTAHQPPADHKQQIEALIRQDRRGDAIKFFITKVMGAPAFLVWVMRLLPFWKKLKAVAHTLPYDMAIMGDFSFPESLAKSVKIPTLVLGGEKSPVVLRKAVEYTAKAMPNAKSHLLAKQSHNVSMKVLAPAMIEFLIK